MVLGYTFDLKELNQEQALRAFGEVLKLDNFKGYEVLSLKVDNREITSRFVDISPYDVHKMMVGATEASSVLVGLRPSLKLSSQYKYEQAGDILSLGMGVEKDEQSGTYRFSIINVGIPNYEENPQAKEIHESWRKELDGNVRRTLSDLLQ